VAAMTSGSFGDKYGENGGGDEYSNGGVKTA
jgi:hypothetical protein